MNGQQLSEEGSQAKAMARDVFSTIRGFVQRSIAPAMRRLEVLEAKPEPGLRELTADERKALVDSIYPHIEAAHAKWALDFERSATQVMLKAVAAIPEPKDGRDGVNWDDIQIEYDGKRSLSFITTKGDARRVAEIRIPCVLDAGFYKEGLEYEQGDGVTFGGSYWIALKSTSAKPEVGSEEWRLAVRKGRDGKSADRAVTRPVLQVP